MRPRVFAAKSLIRLSRLADALALMVMRPADLIEFGRRTYSRPGTIAEWGSGETVDAGLSGAELQLLDHLPARQGRLLLLGVGGGREAIALARMGFEVTGVDFVPEMVELARANAAMRGFKIDGLVQNLGDLRLPAESYDVAWLSAGMYSSLPTRERRVGMLRKVRQALRSDGFFLLEFCRAAPPSPVRVERIKRAFAGLTRGNTTYERGDMLNHQSDFIHAFGSETELRWEFAASGFSVVHLSGKEDSFFGGAALRKERPPPPPPRP
jgi:SAM-dependent methyltransferase